MNEVAVHLDALAEGGARAALHRCCASNAWVDAMLRERPFRSDERLFAAADRIWAGLAPRDWREAFAGHPRIGERAKASHAATANWSTAEQSGMNSAAEETARALAEGNQRYEATFGHVFLICATGKSADEMLRSLNERICNPPEVELRNAAEQQALITRLRLKKLVQP